MYVHMRRYLEDIVMGSGLSLTSCYSHNVSLGEDSRNSDCASRFLLNPNVQLTSSTYTGN